MKITYLRPAKAKQTGANPNKVMRFVRNTPNGRMPAMTSANVKRISAIGCQTAQDVFQKNYEALASIKFILGK